MSRSEGRQSGVMDQTMIFDHAGDRMRLIIDSYASVTGRPLLPWAQVDADSLWQADIIVVAHATEADPIFFYANKAALDLFGTDAAQLIRMPSRLSAKAVNRDERERLFERVRRQGFIDDYAGDRVTATGREFRIERATVWNLVDVDNAIRGQAARFDTWRWL
jgi:PAS domain-containing protein